MLCSGYCDLRVEDELKTSINMKHKRDFLRVKHVNEFIYFHKH